MMPSTGEPVKGFFSSLFDFSFTSYITPRIIKVIFGIVVIVSALVALILVVAAFRANAAAGILVLIVVAPLAFLLYVISYRVMLEVVMAVFAIAEHTRHMAAQSGGSPLVPGADRPGGGYTAPPVGPPQPSSWGQAPPPPGPAQY